MRIALVAGMVVLGSAALSLGAPEDDPAPRWRDVLGAYDHAEAYNLDPQFYAPWVAGTEPGVPLDTLLHALREMDGVHDGWVVDPKFPDELSAARWVGENLRPMSGPLGSCDPTIALVARAQADSVILLIDKQAWTACIVDNQGRVPGLFSIGGEIHARKRYAAAAMPWGHDHAEVLASAKRITPEDRAALEGPDELTIFALTDASWEAAIRAAQPSAKTSLEAALAALARPDICVGRVSLERPRARESLGKRTAGALTEPVGLTMMCWMPHHAVLARRGSHSILAVLCFDCNHMQLYSSVADTGTGLRPFAGPWSLRYDLDQICKLHGITPTPSMEERARKSREAEAAKLPAK